MPQNAMVPGNPSVSLPNLGDGAEMTPRAERRQGDVIARGLYRDPNYIDDPVIMDYVQSIWQPLLEAARLRGDLPPELDEIYAWEILLGREPSVNAFALPGGYLGLHLGLVGVVSSRDELASVLAHELSHVTQRHISRITERKSAQSPWLIGAMVLGVLAASKDPDAGNAILAGGSAASIQSEINFSRDMEREADRIGFGVMSQAGFAPQGFVSMFAKLQHASRLNDGNSFPYLRVHPLTTERLSDMQNRIGPPDIKVKNPSTGDPWLHAIVSARARVLSSRELAPLRTWADQVSAAQFSSLEPVQQAGILYGATLAAIQLHDYASAKSLWTRLRNTVPAQSASNYWSLLLGVELFVSQGDSARALGLLKSVARARRASRAELLLSAQAKLLSGQAAEASQSLQLWVADHPRDAQAWLLLSRAYATQNQVLNAVRAEAESSLAQLDYTGALTRLKAAQEMMRKGTETANRFELSIIQARARQVESLVREQVRDR